MIEVKLSFATIEAAITALAAVRAAEGKSDAPKPETAKPDAKPKKATAETPSTAGTAGTVVSPTPPAESKSPASESGVTKEQISAAITLAVKTHRPQVVELLAGYSAKSAKDLKPESYAEFLAKLEEATKVDDLAG